LDDTAVIKNEDLISLDDRGQSVSHDESRAADDDVFERFLDEGFGFVVD
jgi:hypothetical protein